MKNNINNNTKIEWDAGIAGKTPCDKGYFKTLLSRHLAVMIFCIIFLALCVFTFVKLSAVDKNPFEIFTFIFAVLLGFEALVFIFWVIAVLIRTKKQAELDMWFGVSPEEGVVIYSEKKAQVLKTVPFSRFNLFSIVKTKKGYDHVFLFAKKPRKKAKKLLPIGGVADSTTLETELLKYITKIELKT